MRGKCRTEDSVALIRAAQQSHSELSEAALLDGHDCDTMCIHERDGCMRMNRNVSSLASESPNVNLDLHLVINMSLMEANKYGISVGCRCCILCIKGCETAFFLDWLLSQSFVMFIFSSYFLCCIHTNLKAGATNAPGRKTYCR